MKFRPTLILLTLLIAPLMAADEQTLLPDGIDIADTISNDAVLQAINGEAGAPQGQRVAYFADNAATSGYLAVPEGDGPFPAVLLIHEWNGLVERIQQTADAFAAQGYVALAADLYQGQTGSNREENIALMQAARGDEQAIIDNLDAAVNYLRTQTPAGANARVASIGWCFGGGIALSYAIGSDAHDGTAIFYGSLLDDPEQMAHIHHEVYGTFAAEDRGIPVQQVDAFVAALRSAGVDNDVHIYDHVQHGFWLHNERDPEHNQPAAIHAWNRLKAYLQRVL